MINKNEVVVYLENDGKLVRYGVSYDKTRIMSYRDFPKIKVTI